MQDFVNHQPYQLLVLGVVKGERALGIGGSKLIAERCEGEEFQGLSELDLGFRV